MHFLQNTKIMPASPRHKFINERHIVTLLIYELRQDDAGLYQVQVTNSAGTSRSKCNITLKEPEKPRPPSPPAQAAPEIASPLEPQTVEEGQSITLKCNIKGHPSKLQSVLSSLPDRIQSSVTYFLFS